MAQNQQQQQERLEQAAPQLHQHINLGIMQNEEIPLNRLNSTEERAERRRIRDIFNTVSVCWYSLICIYFVRHNVIVQ